jgi:hypothetical protein
MQTTQPPARPEPERVRFKGTPHQSYQPETGHRYTADAEGLIEVRPEHAEGMIRMGCAPVET